MPDEERFQVLFRAVYPDLVRFVERRLHPLAGEDVVAEVFVSVRVGTVLPADVVPDGSDQVVSQVDLARAWCLLSPSDQEALTLAPPRRGSWPPARAEPHPGWRDCMITEGAAASSRWEC